MTNPFEKPKAAFLRPQKFDASSLAGRMVAIFDLDDTLSDTSRRKHYVEVGEGGKKDWQGFFAACGSDPHRQEFLDMALRLQEAGVDLVIFSGRPRSQLEASLEWLAERGVSPHLAWLRPERSFAKSWQIKKEWLAELLSKGAKVVCAVDDEGPNLEVFRAAGVLSIDAADARAALAAFEALAASLGSGPVQGPPPARAKAKARGAKAP